jgi:hypothetical protein
MTTLLLLLLSAPPAPLHEQAFRLELPAEAVAVIHASCERCDWGTRGRESAILALSVDGVLQQHLVLTRGARGEYRVLLGALPEGEHRIALALDARRSARGTGAVRVESVSVEAVAADEPGYEALAHAPIVHTRKRSLDRFSDVPLVAWVEAFPVPDGGRELRYSIVFSHEDGGTPLDRLMATWGRATDIELVYAVELDAAGRVRRAEYQGKDHVTTPFAGRREGSHPVLYVVTRNNMLSDRGPATPRVALAPVPFSLDGVSREAVMDAHPWTYEVSAAEVRREGLVKDGAAPGSKRIPDPRRFAYLEACGSVADARLAFDVGLRASDGGVSWRASDAGRPAFRVARSGCFRAAVALPRGAAPSDVQALRLRAHTRPKRRGESPLPKGAGSARLERVNLFFGLGADDRPGPSLFSWTGAGELVPDGPPLELPLRPR